ncbi:four-helix bundle copper-binding protein [Methylobacterium oxalidis]|uniref:four-helix bundle copper-binding protein n=1 Tax=Methylobacterium oxalidis TaxID=944322 RepID=UPI0033147356
MSPNDPAMQACIDACLSCYRTCLGEASNHCLVAGGKHVEPEHVRLMLACAETCRTSAHLMLLGTPEHRHACAACAALCEACAASCERVGGMESCVAECRRCAESCRKMAG